LLISQTLPQSDCGTFIDQMLNENAIHHRYSNTQLPDTICWLQAKQKDAQYIYSNEYALVYISGASFVRDFPSGVLTTKMKWVKEYAERAKQANNSGQFKVVVLFNSVSDSLPQTLPLT
jgi:hypothetical protein